MDIPTLIGLDDHVYGAKNQERQNVFFFFSFFYYVFIIFLTNYVDKVLDTTTISFTLSHDVENRTPKCFIYESV